MSQFYFALIFLILQNAFYAVDCILISSAGHYSGKETVDAHGKENLCRAISVAKQVFNTLTEMVIDRDANVLCPQPSATLLKNKKNPVGNGCCN